MKRATMAEWSGGEDEARHRELLARHGLAVGSKYGRSEFYLAIDPRKLRKPPTGWSFVSSVEKRLEGSPLDLSDGEKRDFRAFWLWYLPVESAVLELCQLVVFFADDPEQQHRKVLGDLIGALLVLKEHYRTLVEKGAIGWLPNRLGWGNEPQDIVGLMSKHANAFGDEPPEWATEAPVMERPF